MNKRNKEVLAILAFLIVLSVAYFGVKTFLTPDPSTVTKVEVRHKDDVILEIDLSKDDIYEIEVEHGYLYVEVKDGQYRVFDVDCPDKICEKVGWVKKGSEKQIICLPNNIILVQG